MSYQRPQYPWQQPLPPYIPGPAQPPPFTPPPRKRSRTRWLVLGSVVGLVLGVCVVSAIVGGGSPGKVTVDEPVATANKAAAPKTYNLPVGSTMTVTDGDGSRRAGRLRSVKTFGKACGEFAPAPDNGKFVVVDIVVAQVTGTGSVNPLDFTFVAADGTSANGLSGAFSACDKPSLASTNSLRAGQKRAGKIAFDTDSSAGTVEWAPGGLGAETIGSWKVG